MLTYRITRIYSIYESASSNFFGVSVRYIKHALYASATKPLCVIHSREQQRQMSILSYSTRMFIYVCVSRPIQ